MREGAKGRYHWLCIKKGRCSGGGRGGMRAVLERGGACVLLEGSKCHEVLLVPWTGLGGCVGGREEGGSIR